MSEKLILGITDCAIIGIMLSISAGIGMIFRVFGGQQKTDGEYLLAGRNMSIFPVSLSLMATFMSATTLIGIPADMYLYGTHMAFMNIGFVLGPVISSYVFLPIYFDNKVSTAYQYLEGRFGKSTRRILCGIFLIQNILYNGVILYAPALALSAVTNLSIWISVISISVVCTFYSTLGGMKAVLWTDVFQGFLMLVCLFAIAIKGCLDHGGIGGIFRIAHEGGRMVIPTALIKSLVTVNKKDICFDLNFSTRYTMYSVLIQGLIIATYTYGCEQVQVQRQLTVKNLKYSTISVLISSIMLVVFHLLCCFCGLVFYAHYKECDPMISTTKPIHSIDQLMPLYVTSTMSQFQGLAGLCIAGIFSATLSTLSSTVNSMAAVTYEDIIKPIRPNLSGSVFIPKIASVVYGALSVLITYMVASLGNLLTATLLVVGIVSGPGLGVFLLAAFTTRTTEMGANLGMIASVVLAGCMTFIPNRRYYMKLEVGRNCSIQEENWINSSFPYAPGEFTNISSSSPANTNSTMDIYPEDNFPVSYMWIAPISLVVCVVVGYFGSWIICCFSAEPEEIPEILLNPLVEEIPDKAIIKEKERLLKLNYKQMPVIIEADRIALGSALPCLENMNKSGESNEEEI